MKQTEQTDKSTQQARIRREQFINRIIDNLGWDALLRITKLAKQNRQSNNVTPSSILITKLLLDREKQKQALDDKMCEAHTRIVSSD